MVDSIKVSSSMRYVGVGLILILIMIVVWLQLPARAASTFPDIYELVSVNNQDSTGINSTGIISGVSGDGSKILFTTQATNLPSAPSSLQYGGYLRDMNIGATVRVDLSESGVLPDKHSFGHKMSTTGRYVIFTSQASNLIDGTVLDDVSQKVFLKDLATDEVELIGQVTGSATLGANSVSDDGRFVVLTTTGINQILPGSRTGSNFRDLLQFDRVKQEWSILNKGLNEALPTANSYYESSSCDGALVAFSSDATNLVADHTGSGLQAYIADTRTGVMLTNITPGVVQPASNLMLSCNGRYVTYRTKDRTLIPTPVGLPSVAQVVRFDRINNERTYVHTSSYDYTAAMLSPVTDDGDVVLSAGPANNLYGLKVYFKHMSDGSGTLEPVQHNYAGLSYSPGFAPGYLVSANGKFVVVSSRDSVVLGIPGSKNTNGGDIANIIRIKTGL